MNKNMIKISITFMLLAANSVLFAANIIVAPNPWVPDDDKAATGAYEDGVSFVNIPQDGEIFIYTISGNLVTHVEYTGNISGTIKWSGKNDDDQYVASGVYIWVLKSAEVTKSGKLIVIR